MVGLARGGSGALGFLRFASSLEKFENRLTQHFETKHQHTAQFKSESEVVGKRSNENGSKIEKTEDLGVKQQDIGGKNKSNKLD